MGKIYVYIWLMYELYQKYGFFKFVLVVLMLVIKEGVWNFIISDYVRQYFLQFYENMWMEFCIINVGDFKVKLGCKNFLVQLLSFIDVSCCDSYMIQVLLINV